MIRGKFEARFSIMRKMSENHCKKKYKPAKKPIKQVKNIGQGIRKLLSDNSLKDYSMVDDTLKKADLMTKMIQNRKMSKKDVNNMA